MTTSWTMPNDTLASLPERTPADPTNVTTLTVEWQRFEKREEGWKWITPASTHGKTLALNVESWLSPILDALLDARAALSRAEADGERLDWIENQIRTSGLIRVDEIGLAIEVETTRGQFRAATLRKVLDRARSGDAARSSAVRPPSEGER